MINEYLAESGETEVEPRPNTGGSNIMIDISKGRYWDKPWSLVSGCTPCSPGCDHCWSASMARRFESRSWVCSNDDGTPVLLTDRQGRFTGRIEIHPERLSIPLKRRKPTVYAVWNDLFHEAVPDTFIGRALSAAIGEYRHTFIVLTKRAERMASLMSRFYADAGEKELRRAVNVWSGLTVCNQQEADEKIPIFFRVPGKKFLSIEPMLGPINLNNVFWNQNEPGRAKPSRWPNPISSVILGGETGPGARPMHPDWVRSVRDQCAAAGVPFFLKFLNKEDGRVLDGKTYNVLPWKMAEVEGNADRH